MKKIFYRTMLIFLIINSHYSFYLYAQSGWILQYSGTTNDLYSVSFADSNKGVVVGTNGIILKTTNGGETWIQQTSNTFALLHSVSYIDSNLAIAVGSNGTIIRTINGGTNWSDIKSGTTIDLNALSFTSENIGTAVGGLIADSGIVLNTTDGGLSWVRQTIPTTQSLWAVSFNDRYNGTAVGYYQPGGTILHTTDGGLNWTNQSAGQSTDWLRGVQFVNSQFGMAAGLFTTVIRTTDGGSTWVNLYPVNRPQHYDGIFLSDINNATIVGYGGEIDRTTDSGESWTTQNSGTDASLIGVYFIDSLHGIIVGTNGTILHTTTGGLTSIHKNMDLPITYELLQNYPNPFNPSTTISYEIPKSGLVIIKIYDVLGREIETLVNEEKSPGKYKVDFSGLNLSSGIYFYRITINNYTETKKMLLMK